MNMLLDPFPLYVVYVSKICLIKHVPHLIKLKPDLIFIRFNPGCQICKTICLN